MPRSLRAQALSTPKPLGIMLHYLHVFLSRMYRDWHQAATNQLGANIDTKARLLMSTESSCINFLYDFQIPLPIYIIHVTYSEGPKNTHGMDTNANWEMIKIVARK